MQIQVRVFDDDETVDSDGVLVFHYDEGHDACSADVDAWFAKQRGSASALVQVLTILTVSSKNFLDSLYNTGAFAADEEKLIDYIKSDVSKKDGDA